MASSVSIQIKSRDIGRAAPYRLNSKILVDSPLNDFLCCNCFFPVVNARQIIGCGCRICEQCFLEIGETNGANYCRKCNLTFNINQTFRDKASDNELKRKIFPCFYLECPEQISAFEYRGHIANCDFADIKCINPGCNKTMPRTELKEHKFTCQFRNIRCQWCHREIQANNRKRHEVDECQEFIMNCPSGCGESVIRKNIRDHIDHLCKIQTRLCPFMRYGCSTKGKFDMLEKHKKEKVIDHLEMVAKAITDNDALHDESASTVGIQTRIRDTNRKLSKLQTEVNSVSNDMRVQLNRISETTLNLETMMNDMQINFQELSILVQTLQATSYNGQFIWKIPDLKRRKEEAITSKTVSLYSAPFFTSRFGYKLCLRLYLDGDGSGRHTHISFFLTIMKGEYDALLPWPFSQMVTLTLFDQNKKRHITQCFKPEPSSSSFWRPHSEMNVASGCPKFAPISVLSDPNYVQDNTIFFKALIDTTGLSQP